MRYELTDFERADIIADAAEAIALGIAGRDGIFGEQRQIRSGATSSEWSTRRLRVTVVTSRIDPGALPFPGAVLESYNNWKRLAGGQNRSLPVLAF
jgi:hypothetical protein